ncbi:MAG TPA: multicopper oxidase domain-containing protein [Candidatus Binatia bacterium]|nr:multicopper oxidase domain-containing protein [Candidatus Binatia bacterium]
MRAAYKLVLTLLFCGFSFSAAWGQCPARPASGTVVQDALSLYSQNGVLNAGLNLGYSVDQYGYTHYCYRYQSSNGVVESPTLRVNPGDKLMLNVTDSIPTNSPDGRNGMHMHAAAPAGTTCGDGGTATLQSTNVHFHGLNVPPTCHQDDVLTTLIQPGDGPFQYSIQIPTTEPPGLYWYHPHVHGFTEFQVNGGAAGALVVEGMDKVRPEVSGLPERVFVIRQQYLVPWVPGPYQLTINYQTTTAPGNPLTPIIQMKPGQKEFWRVANATLQDFMPVQVLVNGAPEQLELVALDGYPLSATRMENTILIPPAGRAEFIVTAPASGGSGTFQTLAYNTGLTGNADILQAFATIQLVDDNSAAKAPVNPIAPGPKMSLDGIKFAGLKNAAPTASRSLFFSEEFGGTNGPIQFYVTVDGQKQVVFNPNEAPAITTKVGAVEDWTIENRALETHAFHIHQIHFMMLEVDGKAVPNDMRDTIEIPYWTGSGPYHSVKVRMDFTDPTIAGTFVFHCHILLHEDLGMMHKILVQP